MNELVSLPGSIRQRIEHAQRLLEQGRPQEAATQMQSAELELAKSSPELFAILTALNKGYRGIRATQTEYSTTHFKVEHRFLGILVGEEWVPRTTVKRTVRTMEFFK